MTTHATPSVICPKEIALRLIEEAIDSGYIYESEGVIIYETYLGRRFQQELERLTQEQSRQISLLTTKLAALEAANRWIPVGERLPENHMNVLVQSNLGIYTGFFGTMRWYIHDETVHAEVTHWRPLPEGPKEEK